MKIRRNRRGIHWSLTLEESQILLQLSVENYPLEYQDDSPHLTELQHAGWICRRPDGSWSLTNAGVQAATRDAAARGDIPYNPEAIEVDNDRPTTNYVASLVDVLVELIEGEGYVPNSRETDRFVLEICQQLLSQGHVQLLGARFYPTETARNRLHALRHPGRAWIYSNWYKLASVGLLIVIAVAGILAII